MGRKRSKTLEEAKERFIQGCKNQNPKEIAIASFEILLHDKKRLDVLNYELWFSHSLLEKIEADNIDISKLSARQIRNFVIQEWKEFKSKRERQNERIDLSEEQEKEVIRGVSSALRKIKKESS